MISAADLTNFDFNAATTNHAAKENMDDKVLCAEVVRRNLTVTLADNSKHAVQFRDALIKLVGCEGAYIGRVKTSTGLTIYDIGIDPFFQTWITPDGLRKLATWAETEHMPLMPGLARSIADEADDGRILTVGTGKGKPWFTVLPPEWTERLYGAANWQDEEGEGQDEE